MGQRSFRFLLLGRTTSFIGNAFANIALAFAVLDLTGSRADLGLVLAARTFPQVLFLLVGGIWADRLPRNQVMVLSNVVSGLSQGVVAVLLLTGSAEVWQLAALGAVNGLSSAFFFPAASGIVPQTVPERMLQPANALLRLGINASWIVGAAAGGLVVAATSPESRSHSTRRRSSSRRSSPRSSTCRPASGWRRRTSSPSFERGGASSARERGCG